MMLAYSSLLLAVLVLGSPYWLVRMATSGRYRAGLWRRLGVVPLRLRAVVRWREVVWVHAVSVGEVMAATRLVGELSTTLGDRWVVVISTTTATGQALAKERLGAARVFFYPIDIGWAVRAYLKALQPKMLVLMESELWPRMLVECDRAGVPVVVVNARVSDRSFARGLKVRSIWVRMLRRVRLFLAQSEEDARRLVALGASEADVRVGGNLKYDVRVPKKSRVAELIREVASGRRIVVAGSTVDRKDSSLSEDEMVIQAWEGAVRRETGAMLVLAPRHPERFGEVEAVARGFRLKKVSELTGGMEGVAAAGSEGKEGAVEVVLLDTIGDLAAVYGVADVAFVGGSLVPKGGHNPLEPAQFGVPVVMGPSHENFRDVVGRMLAVDGIVVVKGKEELTAALVDLLTNAAKASAIGARGRGVFDAQAGATGRTVEALIQMLGETAVQG
jgi:3-deoxy-D-manno-octulosonic-acid transferase